MLLLVQLRSACIATLAVEEVVTGADAVGRLRVPEDARVSGGHGTQCRETDLGLHMVRTSES